MAAKTNALKVTLPSDTEILLTREFDAPRHLVFEALTKPEYVAQWWGPHGSELLVNESDFRPGGTWRRIQRMPDGSEHPFKGTYREIDPPARLVWTFIYDVPPFDQMESVETATLEERDGRTILTALVRHQTKQARDGHLQSGMEKGAGESYDRLAEVIAKMA